VLVEEEDEGEELLFLNVLVSVAVLCIVLKDGL